MDPKKPFLLALCGLFSCTSLGPARAEDAGTKPSAKIEGPVLPTPSEIRNVDIYPAGISLKGGDDAKQMIVTGMLADGRTQDLSAEVKYIIADPSIAQV